MMPTSKAMGGSERWRRFLIKVANSVYPIKKVDSNRYDTWGGVASICFHAISHVEARQSSREEAINSQELVRSKRNRCSWMKSGCKGGETSGTFNRQQAIVSCTIGGFAVTVSGRGL